MIYYPDDLEDSFFFFNQSSNPLTTSSVSDFSSNYSKPSKCVVFDSSASASKLKGLALSQSGKAVLDGNPQTPDNYHYSIGSFGPYRIQGRIAGPYCITKGDSDHIPIHSVELWLRYIDEKMISKFPSLERFKLRFFESCICSNTAYRYYTLIIVFILLSSDSN